MRFLILFIPFLLWGSWVEEELGKMTLDQKIGQLFVAPACPLRDADHFADWLQIMKNYHIGNAIVKESDPISQVHFLNRLQKASELPLLITADAEWGLAMRMTDTIAYPRNLALGALNDLNLIYELGCEIGRQAKRVGIRMNLAPVADINSNPDNPVIKTRSFGDDPQKVADCVAAFANGLQSAGVLACAKHFPGHGDTTLDSHYDLPVVFHPLSRLETVELIPFKRAAKKGIAALMTAHLYVPAIDPIYPSSLSPTCIEWIRKKLKFQGLIITDALNMKAIADRYSPEEIGVLARKAGSDLLLYGDHIAPNVDEILRETIPRAFKALKEAYLSDELDLSELDASVLRILRAKEGIERSIPTENLLEELNSKEAIDLKNRLFALSS